jgi:putative iron-regulated protein
MAKTISAAAILVAFSCFAGGLVPNAFAEQTPNRAAVVAHYADLALAKYDDSLSTAKDLQSSIEALLAEPSADALTAARAAWRRAREPYQQTEVFRFGNSIVDDWEGRVNAWPLDEGLIDYVAPAYGGDDADNVFRSANVVANRTLMLGGRETDVTVIDIEMLRSLHEIDAVEANVATGYHAIEFLLWGQDLNGTDAGAGNRPWTDFSLTDCTNRNCDRRRAYLAVATALLIVDLEEMVAAWQDGGMARAALDEGSAEEGLTAMLTGMGSLSYGELAGERMKLGLLLHDPEEEHDCFSDNTHNSHYFDALGVQNVYLGRYARGDGTFVEGPALADLVRATSPEADAAMQMRLDATLAAMRAIKDSAEKDGMAYDQMIGGNDAAGNALVVAAIQALVDQTRAIDQVVAALDLDTIAFEGSDSLDAPEAVFD